MSLPTQSQFICPILQITMTDPVVAQDGYTYERSAIQGWFNRGNKTSPMTREIIDTSLLNNLTMRSEMATTGLVLKPLQNFREPRVLKGHISSVLGVAVSPNGKYVVTGSWDKTVRVWDLETGETTGVLKEHVTSVLAVAVSPDSKYVVTGSWDDKVRVWDLETGETARVLEGHTGWVKAVAVSPDSKYVVTGSWDNTARVWNLESESSEGSEGSEGNGETVRVLHGHISTVRAVAVSPDGKYVVTGSLDNTACVWNLETAGSEGSADSERNEETPRVCEVWPAVLEHTDAVNAVAVSPDGKYVVTGSDDFTARVWNLETGKAVRVLEGHTREVNAVAVSPDGKYVVTGSSDMTALVWDLETGETVRVLEGHTSDVTAVAVSPNGKYVVTGSLDKTARVWDLN